jgi:CRISPR/Cas system-associated exonuclease Cas4 (RecB family)
MQIALNQPGQTSQDYYTRDSGIEKEDTKQTKESEGKQKSNDANELSEDEKRLVKELQARDSEVKAHEAAHQAAGGGMTGAASFSYQQGPDGRMYAIGGEVSISIKGGSSPQEVITNARQVQAAAMAPANPSGQDFAVATSAKMMEMKAQQELAKEQQAKMRGEKEYDSQQQNSATTQNSDYKSVDISA